MHAADSVEDIEDPHHPSLEEEKRRRIEEQKWKKVLFASVSLFSYTVIFGYFDTFRNL